MKIHNSPEPGTPYWAARFMMSRGADAGLIAAYLEREATLAGLDPLMLHPDFAFVVRVEKIRAGLVTLKTAIESTRAPMVRLKEQMQQIAMYAAASGGDGSR